MTKHIWEERFEDIRAFERYLPRNGTMIRKFFLHVSKKEQKKRFLERIDLAEKNWKFSAADAKERAFWDDYMRPTRRRSAIRRRRFALVCGAGGQQMVHARSWPRR